MKKKDLFRIISRLAMILLLPLALSLTCMIIIIKSSRPSVEPSIWAIIFGISMSLIIAYGYITKNKITSTLSGVFLFPLFTTYFAILRGLADHYFTIEWLIKWLNWIFILNNTHFMLINGLAGYFASRGTKASLLIAILFAVLFIFIVLGMGD